MIVETFLIILFLLIPACGIYKCSGDEEIIEYEGNLNNDNNHLNNNNYNDNIVINNENNDTIFFKKQVMQKIEFKEKNNNIDWGNLEETANKIEAGLTYDVKRMVQDPSEEIKNILNEEKLKKGKEVVKKWIDKNKGEEFFKNLIDKNSGFFMKIKFGEITRLIHKSKENTYMFKDNNTDKEEEKKILEGCDIIGFLNSDSEKEKLSNNIRDGDVLQKQKNDFEELEKQARMKEEQIQEEKLKEKKRLKDIEDKAKEAQGKIVDEPQEGDPESTIICFRYPDGETLKNRRFLKTHKIQNLYDYVTSLGNEIYSEEGNNGFSLYQPFPPKKYTNMENTLEKEGLSPNAMIQIKEE